MALNVEVLEAVRDEIRLHPERLEMRREHLRKGFHCQHCILGLAQVMFADKRRNRIFGGFFAEGVVFYDASKMIGLNYRDWQTLYHLERWPKDLRVMYKQGEKLGDAAMKAEATAQAIDRFIAKHTYLKELEAPARMATNELLPANAS